GQRGFLSIGPVLRIGDDSYMSALYGVTAREESRTGLAAFDAGAGLERLGVQGLLSVPLTGKWRLTTVGRIGTLLTDAEESSLTEEPLQAFFLTAITRRF
ncbi:MAG: MipA/OmpV family protein, partial [Pseudomonadota bacterium]